MIHGFDYISDQNCKVLILGTMPGAESLRRQQYYAYGKNQFWRMISDIVGMELKNAEDYEEKKRLLLENHIALWDVLQSCTRENSSDSNIKMPCANDLKTMLEEHPRIRHICFNGKEAEKLFKRFVMDKIEKDKYNFYTFPSTSPANTVQYDKKHEQWIKLKELLELEK